MYLTHMLSPEQVQYYRQKYGFNQTSKTTLPKSKSFGERAKNVIDERVTKLENIADKTHSGEQGLLSGVLQTAGNAAGALGDIAFEGVKTVLPQKVKDVAKKGIEAVAKTKPVERTINAYDEWSKKHPEASANLEATFDLSTVLPSLKLAGEVTSKAVQTGVKSTSKAVKSGVEKGIKKIDEVKAVDKAKQLTELPGKILQGTKSDAPKVKNALLHIDPKNVKTYSDLKNQLTEKIESATRNLDETLGKDKTKRKISELTISTKVGNQTVTHNYVNDALDQLEDMFKKTNNPSKQAEISQLKIKAKEEGLTVKEINDIAKMHGRELNAYNANGELASGLTKQAAENTRTGLKNTARDLFDDDIYKMSDKEISELIKAKDLAEKMEEAVNKLRQKIQTKSIGARAGYLLSQVIDTIGLGAPKGFVSYLLPRGQGLKVLNALDLEKALQKNLEKLRSLSGSMPEQTLIQKMEAMLSDAKKKVILPPRTK